MTSGTAPRRAAAVAAAVLTAALLGSAAPGVLRAVADLYPRALPPHPYLVPDHALLLYGAAPAAALALLAMLLAPGALLTLAAGGTADVGRFAAMTFGGAYLVRVVVHSALKLTGVEPFGAGAFAAAEVVTDAGLAAALAWRLARGAAVTVPAGPEARRRLLWMLAIPAAAAVLLLPALFWQDMTDDGLEALEIGRSLATHVVPRFPTSPSGLLGLGVGMLAMAVPNGWFVALLGPIEAAARLPLLLYLPVLFAVLCALADHRASRRLGPGAEAAIALVLAVFTVTMVYSASYTPYAADAAAPAAFESLTVLCIACTILFLWQGATGWMLAFAVLGYLARPTGLLVLGLLAIAALALPPEERRRQWPRLAAAIALCLVVGAVYERVFIPLAAHGLAAGYETGSILDRLRYLTLTDVRRVLYAAVPGGILPVLALFAWRRQDPFARQLTVLSALYFLFFYPQAFIALHHFVPVMVLPVVVFWRLAPGRGRPWMVPAAVVAAAAALALSLPRTFAVDRSVREIGRATEVRVGNLNGGWEAYRAALEARRGMRALFRPEWDVPDASRERVGAALGVLYYGTRVPKSAEDTVNYVVQAAGAAAPEGFTLVRADSALATFVRDPAVWSRHLRTAPRTDWRAAIYAIPRTTMHRFLGIPAHAYQVDLGSLPGLWRLYR